MARSRIGFLTAGSGGNPTGIGDYARALANAGITPVIFCNDGDVGIGDAIATGKPFVAVGRVVKNGSEFYSVPDYSLAPLVAAQKHWSIIRPEFHPTWVTYKDKIWIQPINEVDHERSNWLGQFGVEIAKIAKGEGFKVCLFAFSSGEPEPADWLTGGMLQYLAYCEAYPEQAAIALHEYDLQMEGMANTFPWHIGRFTFLFKACDEMGIKRPKVLISEFGWQKDKISPNAMIDVAYAAELYAKYPEILGATIWYLGPYQNSDIGNQTQQLIVPITNFTLSTVYPDPSPTPPPDNNLLLNANFEGDFYFQNGVPEFQVPEQWTLNVFSGPNPHHPSPFVPPEIRKVTPAGLPAGEWELFGLSGNQAVKIFKGSGAWNASLVQFITPLPFPALMTVRGFADLVTGYKADGTKIYATYDPANPAGLWRVNGGAWYLTRPGEVNEVTFEVPAGTNLIEVEFMCPYPLSSSGFFLDNWKLLENETMPECNGLPREPYTRRYNVIPSDATEQQAVAIFLEGWRRTRETAGGSYDDAGIGDLPTKVVNLYGIADDQKQVFINWYNQHYPGTLISFLPIPGEESPFEFAVYPVKGRALQVNSHFNAPRSYGPHEGIDLFAQNSDEIVAVAPGIVDGIRTVDPGTGYGIYVRVKHNERFFTWYTHLKSVSVLVGQPVTAGQTLGLADSTGNSTGDHLHLTLVDLVEGLDGYVVAKVVNPLPYLQKFSTTPTYQYNGPAVVFSPALHGPASDYEWGNPELRNMLNTLNMPVKFMSNGINSDYYTQYKKPALDLVRVFWQPHTYKTPQQAWNDDIRDGVLRFYNLGARDFEVLNEPNLTSEGAGVVWDENNFGDWLRGLCLIIQSNCPGARLWFPGMSPGVPWTNQFSYTNKAWPKVKDLCAGFCLHSYTGIADNMTNAINDIVNQVKESQSYLNLQVPLIVSESSVNRAASAVYKAQVYKGVESQLKSVAGIKGVVWYVSSWDSAPPEQSIHQESWLKWGIWQPYSQQ